jgi:hypothetical protein
VIAAKVKFKGDLMMQALNTMILRASPLKWAGLGLLSLVFCVGGIWMIKNGDLAGWYCLVFFGLALLVSIASTLPNASYLKLDAQGFTMCSMFRAHSFRWVDVAGFGINQIALNKMVLFNFEPHYAQSQKMKALNNNISGFDAGLPDNYGMNHQELADLMNRYKQASIRY